MGSGFLLAARELPWVCWLVLKYLPYSDWRRLPRRLIVFSLALPPFIALQCLHCLGFLIDELLFRGYRRVPVRRPVIISGIPRSGTTHLHRVLARHEGLTSMQSWECLLAPSIAERCFWQAMGRAVSPLGRRIRAHSMPFFCDMTTVHAFGLREPEEDFLALLTVNACFLLAVPFPDENRFWRLTRFDTDVSGHRRRCILLFYRRLIQKHLYFHGVERRYLCKNPSFASWLVSLRESFPDADVILCTRAAEDVVPSQLSALYPGWRLCHGTALTPAFEHAIVSMLAGYYEAVEAFLRSDGRASRVPMRQLTQDLQGTIHGLLRELDLPLTGAYRCALQDEASSARAFRSPHRYQLQAFSVQWPEVAHRFRSPLASPNTADGKQADA